LGQPCENAVQFTAAVEALDASVMPDVYAEMGSTPNSCEDGETLLHTGMFLGYVPWTTRSRTLMLSIRRMGLWGPEPSQRHLCN